MTEVVYRRETCRLCSGSQLDLVLQLAPAAIVDDYISEDRLGEIQQEYPLDVFLCRSCGHSQLLDVIDPVVLYGNYIYVTSSSLGLVEHFRRYCDDLLGRIGPAKGSLVVEIGSNDGALLKFFQGHGMKVLGIDPAREIARQATESGVETLPCFFTSELARRIRKERGPAAIITANNVYAHADDLGDLTDGIRYLLAPDGVFVFEVIYLIPMIQKPLFDTIYHEHLCYHTVKPLKSFFARHGMELIEMQQVPVKGGSLRGTAQLAGGPRPVSPSVQKLIDLEENLGVHSPAAFEKFAASIDEGKQKLLNLLHDLKAKGKTIAGYGASSTVTVLLFHYGLGDLISFLVDDNPVKQHRFSPGQHIPVLPSAVLYERNPDYVLILAWNYAGPIMAKHQAYLDQGGHFIIPLPTLKVI